MEHPRRQVHFELVGGAGWGPVHVDEDDLIHVKSLPFVTQSATPKHPNLSGNPNPGIRNA